MIPAMTQATVLALAWLLIGLLWAYRAVNRKEYSGFYSRVGICSARNLRVRARVSAVPNSLAFRIARGYKEVPY